MVTNKRSDYIDIVKFVALFFMLWGHCRTLCWNNDTVDYYLWWPVRVTILFNMPLFMVVSGFLFYNSAQKRNLKELLIARSKPLLCTIFSCGILYWFLTSGLMAIAKGDIGTLFSGGWLGCFNIFWFLWSALACSLCLGVCYKVTKKGWLRLLLIILSFVPLMLFPNAKNNVWMYPFFIGGFYYNKYKDAKIVKCITKFRYLAIFLFPIFVIFTKMSHYVYFTDIWVADVSFLDNVLLWLFRWGAGFIGSISVLTIVKLIYDLATKNKEDKQERLLAPMGKNSMEIYVLSCIFLTKYLPVVIKLIEKTALKDALVWVQSNLMFYNFVFVLLIAIAYVIGLQLLVVLTGKLKIDRFLFGRSVGVKKTEEKTKITQEK